jgi:hypothetical protein
MANLSSTVTAVSTSSDTAVTAITNTYRQSFQRVRVHNEGSAAGFVSWSGTAGPWHRIPANFVSEFTLDSPSTNDIIVKRIASGTDLGSIYVTAL